MLAEPPWSMYTESALRPKVHRMAFPSEKKTSDYLAFIVKSSINALTVRTSKPNLMGSVTINSDLEAANVGIAALFETAIDKSADGISQLNS